MSAPQITIIAIWALAVGIALAEHGKPRTGRQNVFVTTLAVGIHAGILYWGGFFS